MKEGAVDLIKAISQKEQNAEDVAYLTDFIVERLESFTNYFNAVYRDVVMAEFSNELRNAGRITQEDYEYRRTVTDRARRMAHDVAIDSCKQLNRLCQKYDVPAICPTEDDRYKVADFIGSFVYNIYQEGIGPQSLDKSIETARIRAKNPDEVYNPSQVRKEVEAWAR